MASSKQVKFAHGLIGNLIEIEHFNNKEEIWEHLGLLPETKIVELDGKQAGKVINDLLAITKSYENE
ncbi:hypothetical protein KQUDLBSD_CDS0042 [Staphylococcus phage PG-2021_40]|nr:hypothetical protein [Mammaliicoccus phage vB_MscM-PMS3]WBF82138.1 hypothetical protein [Mammaliicoccus virus vB_MscM-PMS2]